MRVPSYTSVSKYYAGKTCANLWFILLRPLQTLATLLANKTQHCWAQHVASVCTPCCVLLRLVGSCWMKFETGQTSSKKSQQHTTANNMVCKRSQHVGPNNVASCRPTMLRAFARAFTSNQGFKVSKEQNVRFISGNFSSDRFS